MEEFDKRRNTSNNEKELLKKQLSIATTVSTKKAVKLIEQAAKVNKEQYQWYKPTAKIPQMIGLIV